MSVKTRLARLEAQQPPEPFKPTMSFIWTGPHNDAALEAAKQDAEAKGFGFITIRLVPPYGPGEQPPIEAGVRTYG